MENLPPCDYCVMVSRYEDRPNVGLWSLGLRDKLPTAPFPSLAQERAVLDLQSALHRVYDVAGYEDYINGLPILALEENAAPLSSG
jgi:hypothetical protein